MFVLTKYFYNRASFFLLKNRSENTLNRNILLIIM